MVSQQEITLARDQLLERTTAYFTQRPDVVGIALLGSLAAESADAYSDIDLYVIATPDEQSRLVAERLEMPSQWGDLLFNEWLDGTFHCISHFRPFFKIDVWYLSTEMLQPSPWLKLPVKILLDRTGSVRDIVERSSRLPFPPLADAEVSRILSKALAGAHEVVRRLRRGELFFAQTLLGELRFHMVRLEDWIHAYAPSSPVDHKLERRISDRLGSALKASYVDLDARALDTAVVGLSEVLRQQIPELHNAFKLTRSLGNDLHACELVRARQVAWS